MERMEIASKDGVRGTLLGEFLTCSFNCCWMIGHDLVGFNDSVLTFGVELISLLHTNDTFTLDTEYSSSNPIIIGYFRPTNQSTLLI